MGGRHDIEIATNEEFALGLTYYEADGTPRDWTGHTGAAQVRRNASDSEVLLTFAVTGTDAGRILVNAPLADVEGLRSMKAVWDLTMTSAGHPERVLYGIATIDKGVTR